MLTAANISRSEAGWPPVDRSGPWIEQPVRLEVRPTRLWRDRDSSFRSLSQRSILSAEREHFNEMNKGRRLKTVALSRGTESSNPCPSSGESANFQFLARCDCDGETRFIALAYGRFESSSLHCTVRG
jgi:hypothetical protein